jgi:RNA polymerase sigma factor (sigma-70 family)
MVIGSFPSMSVELAQSAAAAKSQMRDPLYSWFTREVLSHEAAFSRFISRLWPDRDEQADFRQEAYARVFQAALKTRPDTPKAFLFTTVRHLIADRVRRERILSIRPGGTELVESLIDEISPEREVTANLQLVEVAQTFEQLSSRCREVLWLRRIQGLSQREVAGLLQISEKTVEKHMRVGSRRLAELTRDCGRGSNGARRQSR